MENGVVFLFTQIAKAAVGGLKLTMGRVQGQLAPCPFDAIKAKR